MLDYIIDLFPNEWWQLQSPSCLADKIYQCLCCVFFAERSSNWHTGRPLRVAWDWGSEHQSHLQCCLSSGWIREYCSDVWIAPWFQSDEEATCTQEMLGTSVIMMKSRRVYTWAFPCTFCLLHHPILHDVHLLLSSVTCAKPPFASLNHPKPLSTNIQSIPARQWEWCKWWTQLFIACTSCSFIWKPHTWLRHPDKLCGYLLNQGSHVSMAARICCLDTQVWPWMLIGHACAFSLLHMKWKHGTKHVVTTLRNKILKQT
jgi:hypothetical protein